MPASIEPIITVEAPQERGLGDMASRLDPSIGEDGNVIFARELRNVVDSRGLGSPDSAHLLGGAYGTDAHADAEAVNASLDEVQSLGRCDDVSTNNVNLRVRRLEVLNDLELEPGITLGGVYNDYINAGSHEGGGTVAVLRTGANGGPDEELLGLHVLRREGEVPVLLQISPGDEGDELVALVHDGKLSLLALLELLVGILEADSLLGHGEPVTGSHDLTQFFAEIATVDEGSITVGNDADKLPSHLSVVGDGDAGVAQGVLDVEHILDGGVGRETYRVRDEAILVLLHLVHLSGLVLDAEVGMDDTDSTLEGHSDGHIGLGHSVHGRGNERSLQLDVLGKLAGNVHIADAETNVPRHHDDIVVSVGDAGRVVAKYFLGGEPAGARVEGLLVNLPQGFSTDHGLV